MTRFIAPSLQSGINAVFGSVTVASSSPYAPNAAAGYTESFIRDRGGMVYNVMSSKWGALGNGGDDTASLQAAATAANAAGGGDVWLPYPTSGGFYGISGSLTMYKNVRYIAPLGTTVKWIGAAPGSTTGMFVNTATAGNPLLKPGLMGLTIDAASVARVTPLWLASAQDGLFDAIHLKNANGVAGQVALKLDALVGTDFTNNTDFCTFRHVRITSAKVGVQCTGLSAAVAVTDNTFQRIFLDDISDTGWDFVSYCDSNQIQHYRIAATGSVVFTGVKINSGVPASSNGVYNVHFADGFIDCASGSAGSTGIVFNKSSGCTFRKLWTSMGPGGSPTNLFTDLNNCSSYLIELFSHDPSFETSTGVWYVKGQSWQTVPGNVNGIQFTGANTGASPVVGVGGVGSDANASIAIWGQGTGGVGLGGNQANFINAIGGTDGGGSAPILAAAGAATDVDLRILNQGKGRTVIKNGIAATGSAPTVGSGGAGTSALSIIAGSTNMAGQFQVTCTGVVAGAVLGVVTFNGAPLPAAPRAVVVSLSALHGGCCGTTRSGFRYLRHLNLHDPGSERPHQRDVHHHLDSDLLMRLMTNSHGA